MATLLRQTGCCGMKEIDNLSHSYKPETALAAVAIPLLTTGAAFCVFSGVTRRLRQDHASGRMDDYGQTFREFLEKAGLGTVLVTDEVRNINSGNHIRVWVWQVDQPALLTWMRNNKFTYTEENGWQAPQQPQ